MFTTMRLLPMHDVHHPVLLLETSKKFERPNIHCVIRVRAYFEVYEAKVLLVYFRHAMTNYHDA